MPDELLNINLDDLGIGKWKVEICEKYWVELVVDDMQSVVDECTARKIPAIQVQAR